MGFRLPGHWTAGNLLLGTLLASQLFCQGKKKPDTATGFWHLNSSGANNILLYGLPYELIYIFLFQSLQIRSIHVGCWEDPATVQCVSKLRMLLNISHWNWGVGGILVETSHHDRDKAAIPETFSACSAPGLRQHHCTHLLHPPTLPLCIAQPHLHLGAIQAQGRAKEQVSFLHCCALPQPVPTTLTSPAAPSLCFCVTPIVFSSCQLCNV